MPFLEYKNNEEKIKEIFKKELTESIKTNNSGIIAKADSLGSLEALLLLLRQKNIPVLKAGIGNVNKTDFSSAKANLEINELDAIIIGFIVRGIIVIQNVIVVFIPDTFTESVREGLSECVVIQDYTRNKGK